MTWETRHGILLAIREKRLRDCGCPDEMILAFRERCREDWRGEWVGVGVERVPEESQTR